MRTRLMVGLKAKSKKSRMMNRREIFIILVIFLNVR